MMSEINKDCIQQNFPKQPAFSAVVAAPPLAPKVYDRQVLLSSDSESEEGQVHEVEQVPQEDPTPQAPALFEALVAAAVQEEVVPKRGSRYLYQDENQTFLVPTDLNKLVTNDKLEAVTPAEIKAFFDDYVPGQLNYGYVKLPTAPRRICNSCYQLYTSTHECEFSNMVHDIAKKIISHADVRAAIVAACDPSHRFLARAELEAAAGRVATRSPDMAPLFEQRLQEYYWCPGCLLWCRRKDHDRNACFVLFAARFYASHRAIGWFPKIVGPICEVGYKKRYLTQTQTIESKAFTDSTSIYVFKLQTKYVCKTTDDGERRVVLKLDRRQARAAPSNRARQTLSSPELIFGAKRSRSAATLDHNKFGSWVTTLTVYSRRVA